MKLPHWKMPPFALREIVEEFVTRDGTDHSEITQRVVKVLEQLENGSVELYFDNQTRTCNIVSVAPWQRLFT